MNTIRKLAEIELEDDRGDAHGLATLWREKPVVLVFIRHFG